MNNAVFAQAQVAYDSENYGEALRLYQRVAQDQVYQLGMGEYGLVYHKIGNCCVKLGNYSEAIAAYNAATGDSAYAAKATAFYNLGMAYALMNDFSNAVANFKVAVADNSYPHKYKAYTAMGNALMKSGKAAEAGAVFRKAALDEQNPEPTRALLNLGVCFMALGRCEDAVTAYETAFQFHMTPAVSNRLYANLGQAYVSCGQMKKAVDSFEKALADKSYVLSDSASVDYQRAIASVSKGEDNQDFEAQKTSAAVAAGMAVGAGMAAGGAPQNAYAAPDVLGANANPTTTPEQLQQNLPNADVQAAQKDAVYDLSNDEAFAK